MEDSGDNFGTGSCAGKVAEICKFVHASNNNRSDFDRSGEEYGRRFVS